VVFTGSCGTGTFHCTDCHSHDCTRMNLRHQGIGGYTCADARCDQCHYVLHQ
jgi:hypothetical protein